ncbi:MAG: hypothetical protein AABX73_01630 [Nanoarchaeota archaeon]
MDKKAQTGIELIVIISAVFVFFIFMLFLFQQRISEKSAEKRNLEITDIALSVQNEIEIASKSSEGYRRQFDLPELILNANYTITSNENIIFINTTDGRHAVAFPIQNVTGQIQKGQNIIRKLNATVFLNQ